MEQTHKAYFNLSPYVRGPREIPRYGPKVLAVKMVCRVTDDVNVGARRCACQTMPDQPFQTKTDQRFMLEQRHDGYPQLRILVIDGIVLHA